MVGLRLSNILKYSISSLSEDAQREGFSEILIIIIGRQTYVYHEIPLRDKQCVRFSIHVCVSFLIHSDETKARMSLQVIKQTSVPH